MKSSGRPRTGAASARTKLPGTRGRWHFGESLNQQRDDSQGGDGVAEADPVPRKQFGREEGRCQSAEAEEEVDEVQRDPAVRFAYVADQRIRASHHDTSADAEQEQEDHDAAETLRAGKGVKCDGDEGQAKNEPNLLAFAIQQRTHPDRGDDEPQRLRKCDGAILRRGEMESVGQVGQDGAQHSGNHSIDENGDDGSEDQHSRDSFRLPP